MKKKILNLLIYISAYIGGIVYVVFGGFVFLKTKDEDTKKTLKTSLYLFLGFFAANLLVTAVSYLVFNVFGVASYGGFYTFMSKLDHLISFAEIVTFSVMGIISLCTGSDDVSDICDNKKDDKTED